MRGTEPGGSRWDVAVPDYGPPVPSGARPSIGILGCGSIARTAHLPAYRKYGFPVAGVWSRTRESTDAALREFPEIARVYSRPEELLEDPAVSVVDIATRVEDRLTWLGAAVAAGKHVLAQKPLALDADPVVPILEKAEAAGLKVAVNQNARWAPVWRLATLLVQRGAVGEVVGVTHMLDKPLPPLAGTHFDAVPHMLITDYLLHWTDITRCWLGGKTVTSVAARDSRVPGQPDEARNPWAASVDIGCADGATALIRIACNAATKRPSCPFWIHGTEGTVRGSILGQDFLELERGAVTHRFTLDGAWFVDGFAGAMGELLVAVEEDREPSNSAWDNLATLRLVSAAHDSASREGQPLTLALAL